MITRELNLRDVPDPLYLKALTIDGKEFYHQPGIMKFTTEHETVASTQGGLLCEELGTLTTVYKQLKQGLYLTRHWWNNNGSYPDSIDSQPTAFAPQENYNWPYSNRT